MIPFNAFFFNLAHSVASKVPLFKTILSIQYDYKNNFLPQLLEKTICDDIEKFYFNTYIYLIIYGI